MMRGKLVQGGIARLRRPLDRFYNHRRPGEFARALIHGAGPLAPIVAANDKWSLPAHIPLWMRTVHVAPHHPLPPSRRILLFAAYRGEFTLNLALAALLAWRGHHVTLGYLPRLGSPSKPPFHEDPTTAPYLQATLAGLGQLTDGRVLAQDLSLFDDTGIAVDEAFVERQARSDTIMRLLRETLDTADPEVASILEFYRELGRSAQRCAQGFLSARQGAFDLALIPNGMTFATAQIVHVAKRLGLPITTFEKFAFRHMRVPSHGDVVFSFSDLDCLWTHRAALGFDAAPRRAAAIARGRALLDERRNASVQNFSWKYQKAAGQVSAESMRQAGISPGERFALVCPNVPFDAGYFSFCTMFGSMREWLVETVRALLERTTLKIVVRSHPGEVLHYGGHERALDSLVAAGLADNPRLSVVAPDAAVNTYGLMEHCHCGFVFSSTTGIEMAMNGKPVVVGADVYFAKRGFTVDCHDSASYLERLVATASREVPQTEAAHIGEEAALFYYMIHFVLQRPYPYDKPGDLMRVPPHELVSSPQIDRYIPTLDTLALTRDEFVAAVARGQPPFPLTDATADAGE